MSVVPLRLIVGLGNPGSRYAETRHNAGAWWLSRLCKEKGISLRANKSLQGQMAQAHVHGRECLFLFPTTLMNLSGVSVRAVAQYYKIGPEEILIAHDELDLPVGSVKLKWSGGHGGHNGLRDIIAQLQSADFLRLRIGIGRPPLESPTIDYVLHAPSVDEETEIEGAITRALTVFPLLLDGEREKAMTQLHTVS